MTLKRLFWAIVVTVLLVGGVSRSVDCYRAYALDGSAGCVLPLLVKEDTRFAPGYSHAKFSQVKVGMSAADVLSLLGPPLEQRQSDDGKERWWWSRSPGSHSYRFRLVVFEGGQVSRIVHEFYVD